MPEDPDFFRKGERLIALIDRDDRGCTQMAEELYSHRRGPSPLTDRVLPVHAGFDEGTNSR